MWLFNLCRICSRSRMHVVCPLKGAPGFSLSNTCKYITWKWHSADLRSTKHFLLNFGILHSNFGILHSNFGILHSNFGPPVPHQTSIDNMFCNVKVVWNVFYTWHDGLVFFTRCVWVSITKNFEEKKETQWLSLVLWHKKKEKFLFVDVL